MKTNFLIKELSKSKLYLEFGAGNSTILADKKKKNFLSVESDKNFYVYMIKKINKKNIYFVNFGVVGFYSYPYFYKLSRVKRLIIPLQFLKNFHKEKNT